MSEQLKSRRSDVTVNEVRWFLPGDVEPGLVPRGPGRRRIDMYHLASLGPESSLKRRNTTGPLEWKARVGRRVACEFFGVSGFAESWVKRRLRERDIVVPLLGDWIDVHKRLWRVAGIEIGRLEIDTLAWWTIAVPTDRPSKAVHKVIASWAPALRASGEAASYPMWVLARRSED